MSSSADHCECEEYSTNEVIVIGIASLVIIVAIIFLGNHCIKNGLSIPLPWGKFIVRSDNGRGDSPMAREQPIIIQATPELSIEALELRRQSNFEVDSEEE